MSPRRCGTVGPCVWVDSVPATRVDDLVGAGASVSDCRGRALRVRILNLTFLETTT